MAPPVMLVDATLSNLAEQQLVTAFGAALKSPLVRQRQASTGSPVSGAATKSVVAPFLHPVPGSQTP